MRAAWYEKQGSAKDVLTLGEMPDRHPAVGEVCIRIAASDINPGDIKKRPSDLPSANSLIGRPMPDWERGAFRRICWHQSNVLSLGSAGQTGVVRPLKGLTMFTSKMRAFSATRAARRDIIRR